MSRKNDSLANLPNLGPTSAEWLRCVGIETRADLERIGVVPAYLMVQQAGFGATLNLLWSLEAGLRGMHWTDLSERAKERLRHELAEAGE